MRKFGLQSAMEYLMTYGWAILIIAVVLGVLYYIGVFNGSAFLGTSCVASSGFICGSPVYSHAVGGTVALPSTSGNSVLTFQFGQQTGSTWTNVFWGFANQIADANVISGSTTFLGKTGIPLVAYSGSLVPGQLVTVSIPITSGNVPVGTAINGYIWVTYQISGGSGTFLLTQIGTISAKAS